ncbi:hypothetical protein CYFUS_000162 [Cystobacter fuscus]|uniref:Uncharacterized protein n=1 Tax=Cystobacter fuscus TaxID=43 RepID=A0A250ISM2_9BACT|nr:hypothetical protein CYFUS_000162 [Cystobacter fuscus]
MGQTPVARPLPYSLSGVVSSLSSVSTTKTARSLAGLVALVFSLTP